MICLLGTVSRSRHVFGLRKFLSCGMGRCSLTTSDAMTFLGRSIAEGRCMIRILGWL